MFSSNDVKDAKIIILSLEGSNRREAIEKRLKKLGLNNYFFYDAINAKKMSLEELGGVFDLGKFYERYDRQPALGEIGCTLSHVEIWKLIKNSETNNWVVLEDDAILMPWFKYLFLNDNFPSGLTLLGYSKYPLLKGLIYSVLRFFIVRDVVSRIFFKGFYIGRRSGKKWNFGTVGYSVDRSTVIKLISSMEGNPYFLADDYELYEKFISINHARPFMVFEDYKNMPSGIEKERVLKIKESRIDV